MQNEKQNDNDKTPDKEVIFVNEKGVKIPCSESYYITREIPIPPIPL